MGATTWVTIGEMRTPVIGIMPRATNAGGGIGRVNGSVGGNYGGLTEVDAKEESYKLAKVDA